MHLKAEHVFFYFIMSTSLDLNSIAIVWHLRQDGINHKDYRVNQQKIMILSTVFHTLSKKYRHYRAHPWFSRYPNNFWRHLRCSINSSGNNSCVPCTIYNPKPSSRFYGRMHSLGYPCKSIKISENRNFEQIFSHFDHKYYHERIRP